MLIFTPQVTTLCHHTSVAGTMKRQFSWFFWPFFLQGIGMTSILSLITGHYVRTSSLHLTNESYVAFYHLVNISSQGFMILYHILEVS